MSVRVLTVNDAEATTARLVQNHCSVKDLSLLSVS